MDDIDLILMAAPVDLILVFTTVGPEYKNYFDWTTSWMLDGNGQGFGNLDTDEGICDMVDTFGINIYEAGKE